MRNVDTVLLNSGPELLFSAARYNPYQIGPIVYQEGAHCGLDITNNHPT